MAAWRGPVGEFSMRRSYNLIRVLGAFPALVLYLTISGVAQVGVQPPHAPIEGTATTVPPAQDLPPCTSALSSSSAGRAPSQVNPRAHSVTLSWKASVPQSSSKPDAIQGYNVYRSLKSNNYNDHNRINSKPVAGTQCVDMAVEPRNIYFYVVKAVAVSGRESGSSNEARAPIPFP